MKCAHKQYGMCLQAESDAPSTTQHVPPLTLTMFEMPSSVPLANSAAAQSAWPSRAARCSGVLPLASPARH
eukprot:313534-Chlamydomonas_euryale.AAC.1